MSDLDALLELQERDTRIDQLRHRLVTLPERDALAAQDAALSALGAEQATVQARRDELSRSLKRLEDEVAGVEAKAGEVNATLYGGTVTAPKELEALQHELDGLKRRQRELEDRELELMEEAEPVDAELSSLAERIAEGTAERERRAGALVDAEAAVHAELDEAVTARADAAEPVPAALLATYDALRPQLGGIAVARLVGNTCSGCNLALSAVQADRARRAPADEVVRCEECGRILVR